LKLFSISLSLYYLVSIVTKAIRFEKWFCHLIRKQFFEIIAKYYNRDVACEAGARFTAPAKLSALGPILDLKLPGAGPAISGSSGAEADVSLESDA
jgi:hypothetical protein